MGLNEARKACDSITGALHAGLDLTPAPDLRGALKTRAVVHMKRVTEAVLPELLRKIGRYDGDLRTRPALLRLLTLTFVRTVELRNAERS